MARPTAADDSHDASAGTTPGGLDHTPITAPIYPLVVRFTERTHQDFANLTRRGNRARAWGAFGLAVIAGPLLFILPGIVLLPEVSGPRQLALALGLIACGTAITATQAWRGVALLRRRPTLPEIAMTITNDEVIFGAIPRIAIGQPRLDAATWPRSETRAKLTTATRLLPALIALTREGESKRRTRSFPISWLDADAATIIAAIEG